MAVTPGAPTRAELDRFFFLGNQARGLIERKRRPHNKLGFALQVTTVHYLGTFLADPTDVPTEVVDYLSAQLACDEDRCRIVNACWSIGIPERS